MFADQKDDDDELVLVCRRTWFLIGPVSLSDTICHLG